MGGRSLNMNFTEKDKQSINEWTNFLSFIPTWDYRQFISRPEKLVAYFTGNQKGKTYGIAHSIILRLLGKHPVKAKNMTPDCQYRIIRCASECLPHPSETGEGEVKNTQYPVFKKLIPPSLIKYDITERNAVLTIKDPQGGPDIFIEFVGYTQSVQSQAGVQRFLVWCDESAPKGFYDEQLPRLMAAEEFGQGGDILYSLTPAEHMGWEFDDIYEKADIYIRTDHIIRRIKERTGIELPRIEQTDRKNDIAVILASSYDNPIFSKKIVDSMLSKYDDDDTIDIRGYGIFKQVSGQIFKDLDLRVHVISEEKYFPEGLSYYWRHARMIDFHERVPWACTFVALSDQNELFVYDELNPSPEKLVTHEIARKLVMKSKDYKYDLNLIDPLATKVQCNTGLSVVDDLNRMFNELKRDGLGTGGYWRGWDTKSQRGRDLIKERLKNSRIVGKPFNNHGLPTIWFLDNCRQMIQSMKSWRWEEYSNRDLLITKDEKDKPQQKWSHFPMTLEAILKESGFKPKPIYEEIKRQSAYKDYFRR